MKLEKDTFIAFVMNKDTETKIVFKGEYKGEDVEVSKIGDKETVKHNVISKEKFLKFLEDPAYAYLKKTFETGKKGSSHIEFISILDNPFSFMYWIIDDDAYTTYTYVEELDDENFKLKIASDFTDLDKIPSKKCKIMTITYNDLVKFVEQPYYYTIKEFVDAIKPKK